MALFNRTLPKEETALFARQISLVADSDVPMQQGLALISERAENTRIKEICADLIDKTNKGVSLHEALKKHTEPLGSLFVEMAGVGEKSGNLPVMLERTADSLEKQLETRSKIRSAVSYPLILGSLMLAVIILLLVYVLPLFNEILTSLGGTMNQMTQGLMNFGLFISRNILWILAVVLVIIIGFVLFGFTQKGRRFKDYLKLNLPWYKGIHRADLAAIFARNLSMLIKSGINITLAVGMMKGIIGNTIIADKLSETEEALGSGERIENAFGRLALFPGILIKLFSVAMETGGLDKTLEKAASIMERETNEKLERLTAVIEPVMIILLSLLVGFILISVILPVTGILNSIG